MIVADPFRLKLDASKMFGDVAHCGRGSIVRLKLDGNNDLDDVTRE